MMLEAYSNPAAWLLVFVFGTFFPRLRQMTGSWKALFLGPLLARAFAQIYFQRNASIKTARHYYETKRALKQA